MCNFSCLTMSYMLCQKNNDRLTFSVSIPKMFSLLANSCSTPLKVENSAKVEFLPDNKTVESGTVFIVICAPGYLPEVTYGIIACNKDGIWVNIPICQRQPTMTTAEPKPINRCTASLNIDNSDSVTFVPDNELKTGTTFVVFCKPGNIPEIGTMQCDEEGFWLNSPVCPKRMTTKPLPPALLHTTGAALHSTTTTDSISGDSDNGEFMSMIFPGLIKTN